jgi:ubiquinone/menaquinone biosynthesis C-methylase UbiE
MAFRRTGSNYRYVFRLCGGSINNAQTFSHASDQYAKNRPRYPEELFSYLSDLCPKHDRAWDCATGNGQAAISLANHFTRVEATDISAEQIEHGHPHPQVRYSISPAEHTSFPASSFDLITVATAFHWFDQQAFFQEVDRTLKPGGVLAIWSYSFFKIEPEIDARIAKEFLNPIDRFWADGNRQMFNGYQDAVFPLEEIQPPEFSMQIDWTLEQLSGFLYTWSAVKRFIMELGHDPVSKLQTTLTPLWSDSQSTKTVRMPVFLRVGRKPA